jgi:hypothetical protein
LSYLPSAFWPSDCGRRTAARKATACADASGPEGLADFFAEPFSLPGCRKKSAPGPLRFAALAGRDLQCQKAKAGAATPPQPRKVIMSGTLEHLNPMLIGENVRDTINLEPQFIASIRAQIPA